MIRSVIIISLAAALSAITILSVLNGFEQLALYLIIATNAYLGITSVCLDIKPGAVAELNIMSVFSLVGFFFYVVYRIIAILNE